MKRIALAVLISVFAAGAASAQTCKAVSADGKALTGAAKNSHMKKCCEDTAKSAEGKPLSGAAKNSYVKKCMAG